MGATGCVRGFVVLKGVLVSVAYNLGVCSGSEVFIMNVCHKG